MNLKKYTILNNLFKKIYYVTLIFLCSNAGAVDRISSINLNSKRVEKIYIVPGLLLKLILPCQVEEMAIGKSNHYNYIISKKSSNQALINAKDLTPTNLIIKCVGNISNFVFDLIPNKLNHQDVVRIKKVSKYNNLNLIRSSSNKKKVVKKIIISPKKLVHRNTRKPGLKE